MYEIFAKLLEEKGLKAADVTRATGIKSPVFSEWKKGKSKPNTEKMIKIANYLGVTVEYLTTGENSSLSTPELTKRDEKDIAKRLENALSDLEDSQNALMFSGEPLDDETRELLKASLENSLRIAKINAKQKFTPKKYRKGK